jgi:hypothetical protein
MGMGILATPPPHLKPFGEVAVGGEGVVEGGGHRGGRGTPVLHHQQNAADLQGQPEEQLAVAAAVARAIASTCDVIS